MKKIVFIIVCSVFILAYLKPAGAIGIGLYGTGGVDFSTWREKKYETYSFNNNRNYKTTNYLFGGGLIMDTNVAGDSLLNYRFTFGYQQYRIPDFGTEYMHGICMSHTLGFGLVRTRFVRLWIGPQLRVAIHV